MAQPKISVVHLGDATLHVLAEQVAAGAEEAGATARVRRLPVRARCAADTVEGLLALDELHWADAIVLGSPSRYGALEPPLRSYVDEMRAAQTRRPGRLVVSGFATEDGLLHGGREATLRTLFHLLHQLDGVVVPAADADGRTVRAIARRTGYDVAAVAQQVLGGAAAAGTGPQTPAAMVGPATGDGSAT
jgi:NAD(P)H dehydrogenase (quinone)